MALVKRKSKKRFEQMMAELEELVSSMEESPELEEAIAAFEKGMDIRRFRQPPSCKCRRCGGSR